MKKKIIALSALALTQSIGTVMLVQNSIVQTYAEQKNKDERELLLGKYVPLKTLKPGIVGDVQGVVLLADKWHYDGEYLTAGEECGNITVEHRIKANGDIKVRVIDIKTVPVDREN